MWWLLTGAGAGVLLLVATRGSKKPISRVVVLGDSLAVGMTPFLKTWATENKLGFRADAKVGRMTKQQEVGDVAGATVIVSLGTNDAVRVPGDDISNLARRLLEAGAAQVFWLVPPGGDKLQGIDMVRVQIKSISKIIPVVAKTQIAADGLHPKSYKPVAAAIVEKIKAS